MTVSAASHYTGGTIEEGAPVAKRLKLDKEILADLDMRAKRPPTEAALLLHGGRDPLDLIAVWALEYVADSPLAGEQLRSRPDHLKMAGLANRRPIQPLD